MYLFSMPNFGGCILISDLLVTSLFWGMVLFYLAVPFNYITDVLYEDIYCM